MIFLRAKPLLQVIIKIKYGKKKQNLVIPYFDEPILSTRYQIWLLSSVEIVNTVHSLEYTYNQNICLIICHNEKRKNKALASLRIFLLTILYMTIINDECDTVLK